MRENKLEIKINKPAIKVFNFTTTPPNSAKWIPGVIQEETSEWPIKTGTIYKLTDKNKKVSEVIVTGLKVGEFIEWRSKDDNYHCRYNYQSIDENSSVLEYREWVDNGEIEYPFMQEVLEKLKTVIENTKLI